MGHVTVGGVNGLSCEPRGGSGALEMKAVIAEGGYGGIAGFLLMSP